MVREAFIKEIAFRTYRYYLDLDYEQFKACVKYIRKFLHLTPPSSRGRREIELLTSAEYRLFVDTALAYNSTHALIIQLLYCTGLRVSELINLRVEDIDWEGCKLFVRCGKGGRSRQVLYSEALKLPMRALMLSRGNPRPRRQHLFLSRIGQPYTRQAIHCFFQKYRRKAHISKRVYPHLLRHMHATALTRAGVSEAQIICQTGHSDKRILATYQHLAAMSKKAYKQAEKEFGFL